MEDISRDLEREIKSYTKPSKFKRKRDKRLILVDDFGRMKTANWISRAARLFFYLSIILGAAAGGLFWLYSDLKVENRRLDRRLAGSEKRIDQLTTRNERLMAKVVLSGKSLENMEEDNKSEEPGLKKIEEKTAAKAEKRVIPPGEGETETETEKQDQTEISKTDQDTQSSEKKKGTDINEKVVEIENFRALNDTDKGDLLVRFKIMNITDAPGDITGHIFILLYPKSGDVKEGLVVPTAPVQNGIPVNPDKGQFFSIAHFKPVKFRVRNTPGPDFFKHAEVVVFNQKDELVLRKKIPMG